MSYIDELIASNQKSLQEMLKDSLENNALSVEDIHAALLAEAAPVPAGGDIYNLTSVSTELVHKIIKSPDRDMLTIVKKILRSTKYAATTYYSVTGIDGNPHHLPVTPITGSEKSTP